MSSTESPIPSMSFKTHVVKERGDAAHPLTASRGQKRRSSLLGASTASVSPEFVSGCCLDRQCKPSTVVGDQTKVFVGIDRLCLMFGCQGCVCVRKGIVYIIVYFYTTANGRCSPTIQRRHANNAIHIHRIILNG
jgi:hypothetical protein